MLGSSGLGRPEPKAAAAGKGEEGEGRLQGESRARNVRCWAMVLRLIAHFDVREDVLPSLRAQAAAAAEGGGAGAGRASWRGRAGARHPAGALGMGTGTPGDAPPPRRVVPGVVTGKGRREAEGCRALACPQGLT